MVTGQASHAEEGTTLRADPGAAGEPRALVLDGDAASLAELERAFAARRVTAITSPDGASGLDRLLDELLSLDVLVVELDLPRRDARAFARLVREAGNEQDLALVVLAHGPTAALRDELGALGVDAVLDRRLGPAAVVAAALEAVSARRATRAMAPEPWRNTPAAAPLGETSWWAGLGELAMVA